MVVFKDVALIAVGVMGAILGIYTSTLKIIKHMDGHKWWGHHTAVVFKDVALIAVGVMGAILGIFTSTLKIIKHMDGHEWWGNR